MAKPSFLPNLQIPASGWLSGQHNPRIFQSVGFQPHMLFEKQLKVENLPITTDSGDLAGAGSSP